MQNIIKPKEFPFLQALCWQTEDIQHFTLDEMLSRYERGWRYQYIFGKPSGEEKEFIKQLATTRGSWIRLEI